MTAFARWWVPLAVALAGAACNARHLPADEATAGAVPGNAQASGAGAGGASGKAAAPRDAAVPSLDASAGAAREIFARECFVSPLDDLAIVPGLFCKVSPGRPAECHGGIECLGPWDCEPRPFARCLGVTGLRCVYPGLEPAASAMNPCESAADCTQVPGGRCERAITHTTCQYNAQCEHDADCGSNARCACGLSGDAMCVAADCWADAECGAGQRCRRDYACGYQIGGYFCTRAQDECRADEDCAAGYCDFDEKALAWRCSNAAPCTIP